MRDYVALEDNVMSRVPMTWCPCVTDQCFRSAGAIGFIYTRKAAPDLDNDEIISGQSLSVENPTLKLTNFF